MGVVHVGDIGGQLVGKLTVAEKAAVLVALPGAEVHLINIHRLFERIGGGTACKPRVVVPPVAVQIIDNRRGVRPHLCKKGKGVGLHDPLKNRGLDAELIALSFPGVFDKALPGAALALFHKIQVLFVIVEVTDYRDILRVGRPHAEHHAGLAVTFLRMCAEVVISAHAVALHKAGDLAACVMKAVIHVFNSLFTRKKPQLSYLIAYYYISYQKNL